MGIMLGRAVEVYRRTRKRPDRVWNAWVCRPAAAVFVAAVHRTGVTPNQITLAALVVALASAGVLVAVPGYVGLVGGVVLFELSYVLDCADGMLARWRGTASQSGHLLDFLMDEIKAYCILAASTIRLFHTHGDIRYLLLGVVGLVALATGIGVTTFLRRPEIAQPPRAPAPSADRPLTVLRRTLRIIESAAQFLIHYPSYILFAALADRLECYAVPYVVTNGVYALRALGAVAFRFGRSDRLPAVTE